MIELTAGRGWEYAYRKELEDQLARHILALEMGGDAPHQYIRGVICGIRLSIKELSLARAKYRQDGDADFDE
jgi:hypothetical protein